MQPLNQPQTAHELLALWDELVQQASPECVDGLRNNRDTYYDAAFRQGFGTGELDDMPEYHEVWWASALRLYLTCRIGQELIPQIEAEDQALDDRAKQEIEALKSQHKDEIVQLKAAHKQRLAQLKEQHKDRRQQLRDREDQVRAQHQRAWGVYLDDLE